MSESVKYKALQGCYWMLYCVGFVYVTYYLQEKGIAASMIGVAAAVCGVISAFLQAWVGKLADRGHGFNWRSIMLGLIGLNFVVTAGLGFLAEGMLAVLLFVAFMVFINCMMPLVNAACFYYQKSDIVIDFGSARAVGSLAFAAISVAVGELTVRFGAPAVVGTGMALNLFLLLIVYSLPYYGDMAAESVKAEQTREKRGSFMEKYPAFILMMIGLSLVMSFHNCIQTYMLMILEHVGGNSDNLGLAIAIAAVVELLVLFRFSAIHKRFGSKKLLLACGVFYCLRGALYLLAGSVWHIYLIQTMQALTFALYASASTYYSDEAMEDEDKVTGQGLMAAVLTVGGVIGNLQGGFAFDALGIEWMIGISLGIAVLGTLFILAANKKSGSARLAEES